MVTPSPARRLPHVRTNLTVVIACAAVVVLVVVMRSMSLSPLSSRWFGNGRFWGVGGGPDGTPYGADVDLIEDIRQVAQELADMEKKVHALAGGDAAAHHHPTSVHNAAQHATVSSSGNLKPSSRPDAKSQAVSLGSPPRKGGFPVRGRTIHSAAKDTPMGSLQDTIFVSIASYRDDECAPTIEDMYERAKFPRALFIGAVEQHEPQDPSCMPKKFLEAACQHKPFCPSDNVQSRRIRPIDAKGPTFGRYMGMLMYRGEKYYMMIDSHNRFVTNWDEIVVRVYKSAPSPKAVLSHYPEAWNHPKDKQQNAPLDSRPTTTFLCDAKFTDLGYVKLNGFVVSRSKIPRLQPWAAAGFLFADANLTQEVPFDPNLDYVFDGEEILYSVRMWTHGWDIFSPSENILYHYYYRVGAKRFWDLLPSDWLQKREKAHRRIQWYLGVTKGQNSTERLVPLDTKEDSVVKDNARYGLGKARTLTDWYKFAGVDPVMRTVEKKWCK